MRNEYEIVVNAQLDPRWAEMFDGFTIRNLPNGEAVLSGHIADQAALYGVLNRIRDLGLALRAVRLVEPDASPT